MKNYHIPESIDQLKTKSSLQRQLTQVGFNNSSQSNHPFKFKIITIAIDNESRCHSTSFSELYRKLNSTSNAAHLFFYSLVSFVGRQRISCK